MVRQAFKRAATKPEGSSGIDFLEAILHERPDLKKETAVFASYGGSDGHTVFIGNEVFKGASYSGGIEVCERECALLQSMEGKVPFIPRVTCVGKEYVFYGMTKMPGVIVGYSNCGGFTVKQQEALAKDIVDFMISMANALPTVADGGYCMHNDFHYENVLIDPETKKLTGIIDFARTGYFTKENLCLAVRVDEGAQERYDQPFRRVLRDEFARRSHELKSVDLAGPVSAVSPQAGVQP